MRRRIFIISLALAAMLAIGMDVSGRLHSPGFRMAKAIEAGYGRVPVADADAIEDETITGSDNEAGYRWAERRSLDQPAACPDFTAAFRQGCEAYVREQSR
jgi:hypothetical protein